MLIAKKYCQGEKEIDRAREREIVVVVAGTKLLNSKLHWQLYVRI